jgi:hypothetical protein
MVLYSLLRLLLCFIKPFLSLCCSSTSCKIAPVRAFAATPATTATTRRRRAGDGLAEVQSDLFHDTTQKHVMRRRLLSLVLSSKGDEPWRAGDGIGAEVRATNHVDSEPGDSALEQRSDGPVKATALTDSGDKGRRPCDRSQRSRREWRQGEWRRLGDAFKRPAPAKPARALGLPRA